MLIYTNTITPRLQYIAAFAGKLLSGEAFELTCDLNLFLASNQEKINYSEKRIDNDFWLKPHELLLETKIHEQAIECSTYEGYKIFFETEGDWPFDIFGASFYLLSRYEEYLAHEKDVYGRYAHENSLAFKQKFLSIPLVNIWWNNFKSALKHRFPSFNSSLPTFTFLPTYDIDIAWSYKHKSVTRKIGGLMQAATSSNWGQLAERVRVLLKKQRDPYDSYEWLHHLHEKYRLKPYYFFLLAEKSSMYDKNISPHTKQLQQLIRDHFSRYPIGIHPSWRSGDEHELLKKEIGTLSTITGAGCLASRQHYIRFDMPETFRLLVAAGIRYDFSMGYGSINGFRASVATPFYWYDLQKEVETELLLFPFCFMEANSFYEQRLTATDALDEMREYRKIVKSVGGMMITIWHNHFFGSDKLFEGWRQVYEQFVNETAEKV